MPAPTSSRPPSASSTAASSPDFEVLPPEGKGGASSARGSGGAKDEATARLIAYVMDNLLKVPGTRARVGINPLLDLVPVFGDAAAVILNALTIFQGMRRGVPKVVLSRMGLNVLLNGLLGQIPIVGEVFAFWYKPTSRNFDLLLKHSGAGAPRKPAWHEWVFVIGLIVLLLVVVGLFVGTGIYISVRLLHFLTGSLEGLQ